jgi:hypothetical protein
MLILCFRPVALQFLRNVPTNLLGCFAAFFLLGSLARLRLAAARLNDTRLHRATSLGRLGFRRADRPRGLLLGGGRGLLIVLRFGGLALGGRFHVADHFADGRRFAGVLQHLRNPT